VVSEIAANSKFTPVWRGTSFCANHVLGLRDQLGAIPLLIDDASRYRDNVQTNNFEKLVLSFARKRRFADSVSLDLNALKKYTASNLSHAAAGGLLACSSGRNVSRGRRFDWRPLRGACSSGALARATHAGGPASGSSERA